MPPYTDVGTCCPLHRAATVVKGECSNEASSIQTRGHEARYGGAAATTCGQKSMVNGVWAMVCSSHTHARPQCLSYTQQSPPYTTVVLPLNRSDTTKHEGNNIGGPADVRRPNNLSFASRPVNSNGGMTHCTHRTANLRAHRTAREKGRMTVARIE